MIHRGLNKKYYGTQKGFKIYFVDGAKIRTFYHIDFVEGSNGQVKKYIPRNEIWIDNIFLKKQKEVRAIVLHEITEAVLMRDKRLSYEKAHRIANTKEKRFRIKLYKG
jgi:hypothetical protein